MSKKIVVFVCVFLAAAFVLIGCVPAAFKDGVKPDRDYPEDELPIMDDAVVYYSEQSDDVIEVEYGVQEDLDDVVDFYQEFFEDNDIVLEDETDRDSKYKAEGVIEDFRFSIKASAPSGKYEEKLFTTSVEIKIEFVDDSLAQQDEAQISPEPAASQDSEVETSAPNYELLQQTTDVTWYAAADLDAEQHAVEYDEKETLLLEQSGSWRINTADGSIASGEWRLEGDILFFSVGSETLALKVLTMTKNGINILVLLDDTGSSTMYTDISLLDGSIIILTQQSRLESAICDATWYNTHYEYYDGSADIADETEFVFYTDGKLEETYKGNLMIGRWFMRGRYLTLAHSDGNYTFPIRIEIDLDTDSMTMYLDDEESGYWVYTTKEP